MTSVAGIDQPTDGCNRRAAVNCCLFVLTIEPCIVEELLETEINKIAVEEIKVDPS